MLGNVMLQAHADWVQPWGWLIVLPINLSMFTARLYISYIFFLLWSNSLQRWLFLNANTYLELRSLEGLLIFSVHSVASRALIKTGTSPPPLHTHSCYDARGWPASNTVQRRHFWLCTSVSGYATSWIIWFCYITTVDKLFHSCCMFIHHHKRW